MFFDGATECPTVQGERFKRSLKTDSNTLGFNRFLCVWNSRTKRHIGVVLLQLLIDQLNSRQERLTVLSLVQAFVQSGDGLLGSSKSLPLLISIKFSGVTIAYTKFTTSQERLCTASRNWLVSRKLLRFRGNRT